MRIECPTLDIDEPATPELIAEVVAALPRRKDPFAILLTDDPMTYMQTLWTPDGFDIEFQEATTKQHYQLEGELVSTEDSTWVLQSYLRADCLWQSRFTFRQKQIDDVFSQLGYRLGWIVGRIARLFD